MAKLIDMTGLRFGRWVVLSRADNDCRGQARWRCQCDCGNVVESVNGKNLRAGLSVSCGCFKVEMTRLKNATHGHTRNKSPSKTYNTWRGMIARCENPSDKSYPFYGGRGVVVCERWRRFDDFLADMGERPHGRAEIDRIDNAVGYQPGNCRWVSHVENMRNTRQNKLVSTPAGEMLLGEAAEISGLSYGCLLRRISAGWPTDRLFEPVKKTRKSAVRVIDTPEGEMRLSHAARRAGVSVATMMERVDRGWPVSSILNGPARRNLPQSMTT